MNSVHESCRMRGGFGRILSGALIVSVLGATSLAGDRYIITRDGEKVRLTKSDSEFALILRDTAEAGVAAKRLAASGRGIVEDLPWAPRARVKILRVAEATRARRDLVRQDPLVAEVFPVYRLSTSDAPIMSTGTITVRLRHGLDQDGLPRLLEAYRLTMIEPITGMPHTYLVEPADPDDDEVLRAEALALDSRTVWAQPNFRRPQQLRQTSPTDEYYGRQWHLNNTGQEGGLPGADINAPEAWVKGGEGQDILVGMLDDSCDVDHEDLRDNYIGIGNDPYEASTAEGFDDPRPKQIGDQHGTAVMGLAVARANALGIRGVAYLSRFTASRGLGVLSDAQIANAYLFARQQEVDVHINSWGICCGVPNPPILEDALEIAFIEGRDLDGEEGTDPPRGMVVVFASGNESALVEAGRELSTLPTVIGVGASNHLDQLSSYSNYGPEVDVLAPGGDEFVGGSMVGLTTTDNDDSAGYIDDGYNVGGFYEFTGEVDVDPDGLYSGYFIGTSAACPVAGGVAALVLSVNPLLTATDVRLILEHTADKINRGDAEYDQTTNRSLRYGYGRINAEAAVLEAQESLTNGGRTWPERPANVHVNAMTNQLTWLQNGDPLEFREEEEDGDQPSEGADILRTTDEFLVLGSDLPFEFIPEDGKCYHPEQIGCGDAVIEALPSNVQVLATGCELACGADAEVLCEAGTRQCVEFLQPTGQKHLAVFARSILGRYSFGVAADTDGNVVDGGQLPPRSISGGSGPVVVDPSLGAKVTISVSPLEGASPLTVQFRGNALSVLPIDDSRTAWDFDIDDDNAVDATTRNAEHTYVVSGGGAKTFIARLTMYDNKGNIGFAQTAIRVTGVGTDAVDDDGDADLQIMIGVPGTVGSDVDEGTSPFPVELSVDASSLVGTVQSVAWDLGDGTSANSLFVSHTYVNNTGVDLRLPITATITTRNPGGTIVVTALSRRVVVHPGPPVTDTGDPVLPGTGADGEGGSANAACGAIGLLPLFVGMASLLWLRRRSF